MSVKQKRIIAALITALYLAVLALIFIYIGKPFVSMLDDPGRFKEWIASHGAWGPIIFTLMTALQVFAAIIPGEPFEIAAGYAFGWFKGTALAILGIALGQTIVFFIIRKFGRRALELFIPESKLDSVRFMQNTDNVFRLIFILFFIPGTPKDILTYFCGLCRISYSSFIITTMVARLPSIISSTVGGSAVSDGNYLFAGIVFGVTALVSIAGMIIYSCIKKKLAARSTHSSEIGKA